MIIPITIRAIYQSEKGNVIHDMWLTSVRGRRTEVAYRRRDRIYTMFPATRQELNDYMIGS